MKKLFLTVIAITCFVFSANAIAFRTTQSICANGEKITMYRDGTFEMFVNSELKVTGKYDWDSSRKIITLSVVINEEAGKWLISEVWFNSQTQNVSYGYFNKKRYNACS